MRLDRRRWSVSWSEIHRTASLVIEQSQSIFAKIDNDIELDVRLTERYPEEKRGKNGEMEIEIGKIKKKIRKEV
jgi:hypothetical protein